MKKGPKPYNTLQRISAVFMTLALIWLTISLPIIYQSQQELSSYQVLSSEIPPASTEDDSNPLTNTTEEKHSNSTNTLSEEFLHDHHYCDHFFSIDLQKYRGKNAGTYIAYHGELDVPPPDAAL
jgi:hypothetical protein